MMKEEKVKLSLLTFEGWSKGTQLEWSSGDLRNFPPIHFVSWLTIVDHAPEQIQMRPNVDIKSSKKLLEHFLHVLSAWKHVIKES